MLIVIVAWMYVALMMAIAEAFHPNGGLLGALITFVMYGLAPVALVTYLMRAPTRRKAIKAAEAAQAQQRAAAQDAPADTDAQAPAASAESAQTDASQHPPADPVAPVRKEA